MSEKKKNGSAVIDRFGGVDRTSRYDAPVSAQGIENFRILNDGSLEKRYGYRHLCYLGEPVRSLYSCHVNQNFFLFALIGDSVYKISADGSRTEHIGRVGTFEGNACFFFFRERLYLLDGEAIYEYGNDGFSPVLGYVPLIADGWGTGRVGKINEPRNILNRHARATYNIDVSSIYLALDAPVESIEAVYINAALMPKEMYKIDDFFTAIDVYELKPGDRVDVYFTYKEGFDELYRRLCSSTSSALFGGIGRNRIFLCCNNRSGTVFSSKNVSSLDILASQKHYPESGELYFPVGYEFEAGDGMAEIQTMIRFYDRVVIFTESDVWMVTPDDEGSDFATTTSVNARIGCPSEKGATLSENEPVSVGYRSVFAWSAGGDGRLDAENISAPIDGILDTEYLDNCGVYYDTAKNELWLYNSHSSDVWVYNTVSKAWYSFTGICAEQILDLNGSVAFVSGGHLYVFDKELDVDVGADGASRNISAIYRSNPSSFGDDRIKNLRSVTVGAELADAELRICIGSSSDRSSELTLLPSDRDVAAPISRRHSLERFRSAEFSIISDGRARQKIHSLTLELG